MNEVVPLDRYPVRPRQRGGESLTGYCLRIYLLNGHFPFRGIIGDSRVSANPVSLDEPELLRTLLGRKQADSGYQQEQTLLFGKDESRLPWRISAVSKRFCPACMEAFNSYLGGQGDVVLIYPRTDAFDMALPVFEFPHSEGLRLWVVPFCLKRRRLLFSAEMLLAGLGSW